ncbi:MAG: hypothetical protein QOI21_4162 [Actinomycetota bacterium]|jgi:DNA-binding CsgD family transcriptional regulator/sugar-specific transcriptional regulator TrmB|nr:hypothetical protein [Actinomycetota bacterium]
MNIDANKTLTADAVRLYEYAVANPLWTESDACVGTGLSYDGIREAVLALSSLRLLHPSDSPAREWDTLSPEVALIALLGDAEVDLRRQEAEIARVRGEVLRLEPAYLEARRARNQLGPVDVVHDLNTVGKLLTDMCRRVEKEVCIAHPGSGLNEEGLAHSLDRDIPLLRRQVAIRTVLQHSTRFHPPTRQYVMMVEPHGALVRTAPIVARRLILFDREIALIPLAGGRTGQGAVIVRESAIVDYLYAVFEVLWTTGRPFPTERTEDADESREELRQAILDHLSVGEKDEVIARRLGLSVRTCRRYIATIMEDLGATSRFQAGLLAHERGLLGAPRVPTG